MNTTILTFAALAALAVTTHAQTLSTSGGTLSGGITYTLTPTSGSATDFGGGDILFEEAVAHTFTFSAAVDFTVTNWATNHITNVTWGDNGFDPGDASYSQFEGNASTWVLTDLTAGEILFTNPTPTILRGVNNQSGAGGFQAHHDWGSATIAGVTMVTISGGGQTAGRFDGYNLSAVPEGGAVPEPSSTALLGLSTLGLLARRKR